MVVVHLLSKCCILRTVLHQSFVEKWFRPTAAAYHATAALSSRRNINKRFAFASDDESIEWVPEDSDLKPSDFEEFVQSDLTAQRSKFNEEMRQKLLSKKIVKHKTIERKHFRPLSSANILTWRAKEQIRYMYSTSPNEETLESIMERFPICEKELKSLLKNKALKKNKADIQKHDELVFKKWRKLLEPTETLPPALKQTLDGLIDSKQIELLHNAAGVADIPELGSPTLHELAHRQPAELGKMSRLLLKHGNPSIPSQSSSRATNQKVLKDGKSQSSVNNNPSTDVEKILEAVKKRYLKMSNDSTSGQLYDEESMGFEKEYSVDRDSHYREDIKFNSNLLSQRGKEFVDENDDLVFKVP
ncbi:hypothetical protein EB796_008710 [Bugula neritina]|uniref:Neugrin n=1 Tax=Bugula neritina TaxID=10212 RepID=A0A7J7K5X1_BUGNE|nr:hypothetical protein EB796_008710 [Bugula neritina]